MNQYLEYNDKLNNYIKIPIGLIVIVVVVIFSLLIVCVKMKAKQLAVISIIGGAMIVLMIYLFCVFSIQERHIFKLIRKI